MKNLLLFSILYLLSSIFNGALSQKQDSLMISRIFADALTHNDSYRNLEYLCTKIGGRLAGTPESMKAVKWAEKTLKSMGLDTVFLQECTVRYWERGEKETGRVISSVTGNKDLHPDALGGSVPTPKEGLSAKVVEVANYNELKRLGKEKIAGKIVFINHPADPSLYNTFAAYGGVAGYRVRGAVQAAYYGAVAFIVRSATTAHDEYPHTGIMHYADTVNKIPAVALSTNESDRLHNWLEQDPDLSVSIKVSSIEHPSVVSYNVIGEIRGAEHPEGIIAFGGHLDCWDNGQGAHDDGAGVVQTMDILRLYRSLGIKPKHTLRAVVFMDEEMEQRGGKAYAEEAKKMLDKNNISVTHRPSPIAYRHIAAIEADRGGFSPWGFSIDATDEQVKKVQSWKNLLLPYGIYILEKGGSGVDIKDLKPLGVPLFGLITDWQRYFDYHHSANDSFDKVNIRELQLGTGAMGALVYLIDQYGL